MVFSNKNMFMLRFPCLPHSTRKSLPPIHIDTAGPSSSNVYSTKLEDDNLKEVFDYLDVNKDGKISSKEVMDYFASVGESVNHKVAIKSVIVEFDSDGDELLEFGDFVRLMKQEDGGELEDVLRSAFEMFEVEKGCGCITPKGLQRMLRQLGDAKSQDECAAMIRAFDLDGNGFLDFHEFQRMLSPAT